MFQYKNTVPNVSSTNPKVSVCVVTFNQEKYIRECLQSIVDQVTDFDFEVVVADDCSVDGTCGIIKEFEINYPSLVRPLFQRFNVGATKNSVDAHNHSCGNFIAHVDGDDYCYPGKLQAQFNALQNNLNISLVAHRMHIMENEKIVGATMLTPKLIDIDWLLVNHPAFLNSSTMIRRTVWDSLRIKESMIDFHLYIWSLKHGSIMCIDQPLGVYRRNIGISSSLKLLPEIFDAIDSCSALDTLPNKNSVSRAKAKAALSYSLGNLAKGDSITFKKLIELARACDSDNAAIGLIFLMRKSPLFLKFLFLAYKRLRGF